MEEHWERDGDCDRLHMERFQPIIGKGDAEHGEGGTIRFTKSDIEAHSDGSQPILVAGEEAGGTLPVRMPHGHLPHLRREALLGEGPRPAHRRGLRIAGRSDPHLHQRARGRRRDRPLNPREESNGRTSMIESPLSKLSDEQIEELGKEFDAIHDEVFAELGDRDRRYIVSMIEMHRRLVVSGRILLFGSRNRAAWLAGTAMLSLAKILENMEIGHNVMHGQWDWMNDPQINSSTWDWDSASTAEAWKHSHNYVHHTYTNIRGKDRDLGYEIMRIDPHQKWHPVYLLQPFYNLVLAAFFEWGVALHDLDFEAIKQGEKSKAALQRELKGMAQQGVAADRQGLPDVPGAQRRDRDGRPRRASRALQRRSKSRRATRVRARARRRAQQPLLDVARESFMATLKANFTANIVRNVWAYGIIFCGHFPDQTYTFSQEETDDETRGGFYVRQLLGAANIDGTPAVPRDQRQPRLPGRAPPVPGHAEHALRGDRAAREGHLRALRPAVQHRPVRQAARRRAAHDPAPRVPGRQAAARSPARTAARRATTRRRAPTATDASRGPARTARARSSRATACVSRCREEE